MDKKFRVIQRDYSKDKSATRCPKCESEVVLYDTWPIERDGKKYAIRRCHQCGETFREYYDDEIKGCREIVKILGVDELTELGFFPLDKFELIELDKNDRVIVVGDLKYTVIERIPTWDNVLKQIEESLDQHELDDHGNDYITMKYHDAYDLELVCAWKNINKYDIPIYSVEVAQFSEEITTPEVMAQHGYYPEDEEILEELD